MEAEGGALIEATPRGKLCVAHEIGLDDFQPVGAQYVISGGDVKIEVRHGEVQEIIAALQLLLPVPARNRDFAILYPFHLFGIHAL